MKTVVKIINAIFGMICLVVPSQFHAQWENIKASITSSDLMKISGEPFDNYKGLSHATFEIQAFVEIKKDKGKVYFLLHTNIINLNENFSYNYRGGSPIKYCVPGPNGRLVENKNSKTEFYAGGDLGQEPFNQLRNSAYATFDFDISYIVKDEKYGISGFGGKKGWGYSRNQIIKNVKANGVYWSEPIETSYPIEITILRPKITSFNANDSALQTAVQSYIDNENKKNEAECKKNEKNREEERLKNDADNKMVDTKIEELNKIKNKLQNGINDNKNSTQGNKFKTDDFWSGGKEKISAIKDNNKLTNNTGYAYIKIKFKDNCNKKVITYTSNIFKIKSGCTNYVIQFHDYIVEKYSKGCFEPLDSAFFVDVTKTIDEGWLFFDRSYFSKNKTDLTPHGVDHTSTIENLIEYREKKLKELKRDNGEYSNDDSIITYEEINDYQPCEK